MPSRTEMYRSRAISCEWVASVATREDTRELFRQLAEQWHDLEQIVQRQKSDGYYGWSRSVLRDATAPSERPSKTKERPPKTKLPPASVLP